MAEFIQSTEQLINANESVVFVNNTDSNLEVGTGIIFRKNGLYEVSVVGNRITVTKVSDLTRASKAEPKLKESEDYIDQKSVIPKQTFNGMTNGEVISTIFPYVDTAIEELLNHPI